MDTVQPSSEIGRRLQQLRHSRGKSLVVVAGLAGISKSYLSMLERGERALDRRSVIVALANALEVAPSELTGEMITPPGELPQDSALPDVRQALMAVSVNSPDGQIMPADVLGRRVAELLKAQQECRHAQVGAALPALVRDLHTTLNAHRDERELLRLVTLLHLQGTQAWLPVAGGSTDLAWWAATFSQQAAERLDEPVSLALSTFGTAHGLIASGAFDLASQTLSAASTGTATREELVVTGMLNLTTSLLAATRGDQNGRVAPLDQASELADQMGPAPEPWFGFGPSNVGLWRLSVALEAGAYTDAVQIASTINPAALPSPFRQAAYWINYGRAMAKIPQQRDKAVMMLRRAEKISPARLHRNPLARETLSELLTRAKRDAVGRELRGMAYRAGLPG